MRMAQNDGLNRRSFLRNAGLTALAGAVAPGTSLAAAPGAMLAPAADTSKFDFDTPYSRLGTQHELVITQQRTHRPPHPFPTRGAAPINTGLTDKDHIVAGMGIADM